MSNLIAKVASAASGRSAISVVASVKAAMAARRRGASMAVCGRAAIVTSVKGRVVTIGASAVTNRGRRR